MAEAIAAIALASSVTQLLQFGTSIVTRIVDFQKEASNPPESLKGIVANLRLIQFALSRISAKAKADAPNSETNIALIPVLASCKQHLDSLDVLLRKIIPTDTDKTFDRGLKAVQSLRHEKDIETLIKRLMEHLTVLLLSGSTQTEQSRSVSLQQKRVVNLHYLRDKQYLDRPQILQRLMVAIYSNKRAVLTGLGGVGKSQLAIEYCYQFKEKNPTAHILWQHVSNTERILDGWSQMARDLAVPNHDQPNANVIALVSDHLSAENCNPWLLILDNADDEAVIFGSSTTTSLGSNLPRHENGQILITTRNQNVGRKIVSEEAIIDVPLLDVAEGLTLLRSKTPRNSWDDANAKKLVESLDLIALAISQAAAYISENRITISDYNDLLNESDVEVQELLQEEHFDIRRDQDIQVSILKTWKLSFDIIKRQRPHAIDILSIMAVMDRQGIPTDLLRRKSVGKVKFTSALGILQAFSLITESDQAGYFNLHRLIQLSMRAELSRQGKVVETQTSAMEILLLACPEEASFSTWVQWHALVPHIEALLHDEINEHKGMLLQIQLLPNIALFYQEQGRYDEAHAKLLQLQDYTKRKFGDTSLEMTVSLSHLAQLKAKMGRYAEAEELHRKAYQGRLELKGVTHVTTMESQLEVAGALWWQEKYSAAQEILQSLLEDLTLNIGVRAPITVKAMLALASTYEKLIDLVKAETLIRQALAINAEVHGADHVSTLESARTLASNLQAQNKHEDAEKLFRAVWNSHIASSGRDHPESTSLQELVAGSLYWQGKFEEAETLQREVFTTKTKTFPLHHPSTLESMQSLASIVQKCSRYEESKKLLQELVAQRTKALGEEHVDTLRSRNDLAFNLSIEGRKAEAAKMHNEIYQARLRTLGNEHPHTLLSMEHVAANFWDNEQRAESVEMLQQILNIRRRVQGTIHPDTLTTMDSLIGQLWGQGDLADATLVLREALAAREANDGKDSPKIVEYMCRLAYLIRIQGQKDDAITLYSRALQISQAHFGLEHKETKTIAQNIPDTLAEKMATTTVE